MSKVITSLVAVLLISSVTLAGGIIEGQDLTVGLFNNIGFMLGQQTASNTTWLTVGNDQCAQTQCLASAFQHQIGFFTQVGGAVGQCSQINVLQTIMGGAVQGQAIGDGVLPKIQSESLTLVGTQNVDKMNGGGNGDAYQLMSLSQNQNGTNAAGPANQSSFIVGTQNTHITGQPGAIGQAGSIVGVSTHQTQTVL